MLWEKKTLRRLLESLRTTANVSSLFFLSAITGFNLAFTEEIKLPDNKRKEAYEMAEQMDEQIEEARREEEKEKLDRFLKIIGMIESSGGKYFGHSPMTTGIQAGTTAIGTYGLMPRTIREVARRRGEALTPEELAVSRLGPAEMKAKMEAEPGLGSERAYAEQLANYVLEKQQGDPEKAAYAWFKGHNLPPKEVEKRGYEEHPYVQKYKKFREELFPELQVKLKRKP